MKHFLSLIFAGLFSGLVLGAIVQQGKDEAPPPEETTAPAPTELSMLYGHNPLRANPSYCVGFHITYPTYPGQAFEAGSLQEIRWSVDEKIASLENAPDMVFRIRIMNGTNHNQYTIGENITLYNDEEKRTGSVLFPLIVRNAPGLHHYRVMINYAGTTVHCIYESIPFFIIQNPDEKYDAGKVPYIEAADVPRPYLSGPVLKYSFP